MFICVALFNTSMEKFRPIHQQPFCLFFVIYEIFIYTFFYNFDPNLVLFFITFKTSRFWMRRDKLLKEHLLFILNETRRQMVTKSTSNLLVSRINCSANITAYHSHTSLTNSCLCQQLEKVDKSIQNTFKETVEI